MSVNRNNARRLIGYDWQRVSEAGVMKRAGVRTQIHLLPCSLHPFCFPLQFECQQRRVDVSSQTDTVLAPLGIARGRSLRGEENSLCRAEDRPLSPVFVEILLNSIFRTTFGYSGQLIQSLRPSSLYTMTDRRRGVS